MPRDRLHAVLRFEVTALGRGKIICGGEQILVAANNKLSPYQDKRDFSKTAEPSGENAVAPSQVRRFIIQKHAATRLHYDFRLELDGVLKSWAVTRGPSIDPHDKRLAVEVEDHPLDYGDFEGTIPKGQYGGGSIQLWDRGYWIPEESDPAAGIKKGELKFVVEGERLHGGWVLVRIKNRPARRGSLSRVGPHDGRDRRGKGP
jgi:bifunctional non-homologous end joining protein LigD